MNLNTNGHEDLGAGIQSLLYVNIILRKKASVKEVAERMGIGVDTLYKYAEGRLAFPAERLADLVNATGDLEYLNYVCEKAGLMIVSKVRADAGLRAIQKIELNIAAIQGKLIEATEMSLDDDLIDRKEMAHLTAKITEAERELETLRESLKAKFRECGGAK